MGAFTVARLFDFIPTGAFVSPYGIDVVFVIFDEVVHLVDVWESDFFHIFREGL